MLYSRNIPCTNRRLSERLNGSGELQINRGCQIAKFARNSPIDQSIARQIRAQLIDIFAKLVYWCRRVRCRVSRIDDNLDVMSEVCSDQNTKALSNEVFHGRKCEEYINSSKGCCHF